MDEGPQTGAEEAWGDKACALTLGWVSAGRQLLTRLHPAPLSEQGRGDCKMAEWREGAGGKHKEAILVPGSAGPDVPNPVATQRLFKGHQRRDSLRVE